jgi:predicted HTH transcriptional regulator
MKPTPGQQDLFAQGRTLARRDDPETSKIAAAEIVPQLGELQAWVLDLVQKDPRRTVSEMAEGLNLRDPRQIGRRLNELRKAGRIREAGKRQCSITNRACIVYEIAD